MTALSGEDQARAGIYALLGGLLSSAPDLSVLEQVASLKGDDSDLGKALSELAAASQRAETARLEREHHRVFIGVTGGEVVPYASFYLTGFLHDRPLVRVRQDMLRLGIARDPSVREPEDHIAALLQIMSGLICGAFGPPASLDEQRRFFARHLQPWWQAFFRDLAAAASADFYRAVAAAADAFLAVEEEAFMLDDDEAQGANARFEAQDDPTSNSD